MTAKSSLDPHTLSYTQCRVNLASGEISIHQQGCQNLEDVLGGFGRSFQILATRDISDAYADENPLVVNTGVLTGSNVMTGLRTYFSAYSPLKGSAVGLPSAMWSAGSGKFGSKLKWTGIDEIIFEGKSAEPVLLLVQQTEQGPQVSLLPAAELLGLGCHEKIMQLQPQYADAHFAVIGPAGENYQDCYFGAVGLSTENQLKSGDDKCRWAGRGGMGSVMGSKNLIGLIAQGRDVKIKISDGIKDLNKRIVTGPGSRKFREKKKGGLGGTWANYEPLEQFNFVPQNNFRPQGDDKPRLMFRDAVEQQLSVKAESCFKCAIACHKNIFQKNADDSRGEFLAKFDYEPLNLLSTNLGIHDPLQAAILVSLCDQLGMDSISLGATIAYVLDYNQRHPESALCNAASFGDFEKIREIILATGRGELPQVGHGVMRLAAQTGDTAYAMHVKGLELPAYLPETNPGYAWAVAGGHMSMMTYMLYALEGNGSVEYWRKAITERGLLFVRDDLIGVCKFAMLDVEGAVQALELGAGLTIDPGELLAAVRRSFIRALWLERKQGYQKAEYTLPAQVSDNPNPALKAEHFVSREFLDELSSEVWAVFDKEIDALCA